MNEAINTMETRIEQMVTKAVGSLTSKLEVLESKMPPSQPPAALHHFPPPPSPYTSSSPSFLSSPTSELPDGFTSPPGPSCVSDFHPGPLSPPGSSLPPGRSLPPRLSLPPGPPLPPGPLSHPDPLSHLGLGLVCPHPPHLV